MAIVESAITVNSSTVAVALGSNSGFGAQGRSGMVILNGGGGGNLYLGGPNVLVTTGLAVASNASITLNTPQGEQIFAVASAPGAVARILEF